MSIEAILDAARSGLTYERLRMDAASRNIAASNVPIAPGQSARTWQASGGFAPHAGTPALATQPSDARAVHDPNHPMADAQGMVRYPAVDTVTEMTTLMTASRGYEANVRSFNLLRGMLLRALEIGAK